jgi:SAM-dependent MidA family methyltransferase
MRPRRPDSTPTLPVPDAEGRRHSEAVTAHVAALIGARGGWIPFADYVREVLYAPGLGYYAAGAHKLGAGGDFTTAPEISDLFSATVAAQFAQVLAQTGGSVLEFGPGSGRLAAVALRELGRAGRLPEEYLLLEVSADLRARQRATIARLAGEPALARVRWLERLPADFTGVVFANELLDALPFERFVVTARGLERLGVALQDGRFAWRTGPADARFSAERGRVPGCGGDAAAALPEGYAGELGVAVAPWIRSVADSLRRGVLLLLDYGLPRGQYYHPQRMAGTLRCHYRHLAHDDPFSYPGLTDITAWVDFTRVAEAAVESRLEVAGFATQAAFLLAAGIEARVTEAGVATPAAEVERAHALRRLLLPGEMGEAVKAIALARDADPPSGFALQDLRGSL